MKIRDLALSVAAVVSMISCYTPHVDPDAYVKVQEVEERNVPANVEFFRLEETSVAAGGRYAAMGKDNATAAIRQRAYELGATCFAVVAVKQGMSRTYVTAKLYKPKPAN